MRSLPLLLLLAAPSFGEPASLLPPAPAPLLDILSSRDIFPASYLPVTPAQPVMTDITLVVQTGTGWERPGVLERVLGKASFILSQCGVGLGTAHVSVVRWSAEGLRRLNVQNPYAGPSQIQVMDEPRLPAARPLALLFSAADIPSTAAAYNLASVANLERSYPGSRKLANTYTITYDQESSPPDPRQLDPTYSVTAHELVHLFGNIGHTDDTPNLMTNDDRNGSHTGRLNPAQCAEVRLLHLGAPAAAAGEPSHQLDSRPIGTVRGPVQGPEL